MSLSPNQRERIEARMQRPFPAEHLKANAEHRMAGLTRSERKAAAITLAVCIVAFLVVCAACRFVSAFLPPQ